MDTNDRFEQEVMRSLGRIEGKLEGMVRQAAETKDYAIKNSERIGKLEQFKAKAAGLAALVGAVVGGLASLVGKYVLGRVGLP